MVKQPPPKPTVTPGLYRHYKNKEYQVIDTVLHSETFEWMVLYTPLYIRPRMLVVRPLTSFIENVEVNGTVQPRFKFIKEL